jgi:hypothetical protein
MTATTRGRNAPALRSHTSAVDGAGRFFLRVRRRARSAEAGRTLLPRARRASGGLAVSPGNAAVEDSNLRTSGPAEAGLRSDPLS